MGKPSHHHGIEHEPALGGSAANGLPASLDPALAEAEARAQQTLEAEDRKGGRAREAVMQSVYEEPFDVQHSPQETVHQRDVFCPECGYNLKGSRIGRICPECGHDLSATYATWLAQQIASTTAIQGHIAVLLAVMGSGVIAVVGTFLSVFSADMSGPLGVVVVAPAVEEVMKVAAVAYLLERRPWLLRSASSVVVAALAGALGFAVIENLIYQYVYLHQPSAQIIAWRWTVCIALHVGATGITTLGLVRLWRIAWTRLEPVELPMALPWLVGAIVLHGGYNALAVMLEVGGLIR